MTTLIFITIIQSVGLLNKSFDANGKKTSNGQMTNGSFLVGAIKSLKILMQGLDRLQSNQAITLGKPIYTKGFISTANNLVKDTITRTKKHFSFSSTSFLLFDFDPSKDGFQIKTPKHFIETMRLIDPLLQECSMAVRYGSSYGVCKDGKPLTNKKSFHCYIIIMNANDEKVKRYKDSLISSAWEKGFGHIELSKSGSVLRRQVFDASVFSPERIIFEASPSLAQGITRVVPEPYFTSEIGHRDLNNILPLSQKGELMFREAKEVIKPQSKKKQEQFIHQKIDEKVATGIPRAIATQLVQAKVQNGVLLPQEVITDDNGTQIKISDILMNPSFYDKKYIYDPLEPEKGPSKAIINSSNPLNMNIYSFIHGGKQYKLTN